MKGEWQPNDKGRCPAHLVGTQKRVAVRLRDGSVHGETPVNTDSKLGWPAWCERGATGTRWTLTGCRSDIMEWREL